VHSQEAVARRNLVLGRGSGKNWKKRGVALRGEEKRKKGKEKKRI